MVPQFTVPHHGWPLAGQITVLAAVHVLNCGIVYLGVGTMARTVLRAWPVIGRAITRFSGAVMIVIGALLLAEALAEVTGRPR